MALANYRTTPTARKLIDAAPASHRLVLLRALNPALATELTYVVEHPDAAVLRAAKLDVDTAVELIGHLTSEPALVSLTQDSRSAVRDAAQLRCANLGVKRPASANTPLAQRTARALRADDPVAALAKMASIDEYVVLEWLRSGEHPETLVQMLAPSRHEDVSLAAHRAALELDLVDAVVNRADPRKLMYVLNDWDRPLNRSVVEAMLRAHAERLTVSMRLDLGITPEAEPAVEHLPVKLRVMLDVVTEDELRAYAANVDHDPSRSWVADREVESRLGSLRSARLAHVAVEHLDQLSEASASRLASDILKLEGLPHDLRRRCWAALGSDLIWVIRREPLAHDDAVYIADALAGKPGDAHMFVSRLDALSREHNEELLDLLCERVDGLGKTVHDSKGWVIQRFFERAAETLGEDVAAWSVLLGALRSYDGPPDELLLAASLASV